MFSWKWACISDFDGIRADDPGYFGTRTKIYGDGDFTNPTAQSDGSKNVSYLKTDYSRSYDVLTSLPLIRLRRVSG